METLVINLADFMMAMWSRHGVPAALVAIFAVIPLILALLLIVLGFKPHRYVKVKRFGRRASDNKGSRLRYILRERIETDNQIHHALANLIRELGCDRAYVNQYHNGGENVCGVPFAKCSRTHERVRPGTPSQIASLQNLPNSMFAGSNLAIMRDREIACPRVEDLKKGDTLGAYHSLREQDISSFYQVGMFSLDGVPVGFLGVDYCRSSHTLKQRQKEELRAYALKLCGMILSEQALNHKESSHGCLAMAGGA